MAKKPKLEKQKKTDTERHLEERRKRWGLDDGLSYIKLVLEDGRIVGGHGSVESSSPMKGDGGDSGPG